MSLDRAARGVDSTSTGARIVAVVGRGPRAHRLVAGADAAGGWCGAGDVAPVVSASASGVVIGEPAAELALGDGLGVDAAIGRLLADLDPPSGPSEVRSVLCAVLEPERAAEVWIALGPPPAAVLVRCWPGVAHGPEAAGGPGQPSALALATEITAGAVAAGRISRIDLQAALEPARREAVAEGRLAERQAALMAAAGDVAGAQVRRALAQMHAVHVALTALRRIAGDDGAPADRR